VSAPSRSSTPRSISPWVSSRSSSPRKDGRSSSAAPSLAPRHQVKVLAGLAFQVLGSYGIAAAEYHDIAAPIMYRTYGAGDFGLSWVTVWVMLFTIVVPAPPRLALLSAALSLSAVPVMYAAGDNLALAPRAFFFTLVLPCLGVLVMSYVGARVVYGLGTAVSQAREMGSYRRLVERLGKGGMGEVWRARHRLLARPAAIKLIRPEVLGGEDPGTRELLVRRFEREAQATTQMRSPHTMMLYDFGVSEDGTFYYAAGRVRPRRDGAAVRAGAARAGRALPPAGLRLTGRGPRGGTHPPRREARQPLPLPLLPRSGLHQGARLRIGEAPSIRGR
jgi:hypothetical protein